MKKTFLKKFLLSACLLAVALSFGSCKKEGKFFKKDRDQKEIDNLKADILKTAGQLSCENSADWKFVVLYEGACGLPKPVAYSTKIDEASLLQKVALFSEKQKAFNATYEKNTMCLNILYALPKRVECVDGKPKFIYQP